MHTEIKQENTVSFKNELLRKMIHISSAAIPLSYFFLSKQTVLSVLIPMLLLLLLIEVLKYKVELVYNLYTEFFSHLLREHEYDRKKIRLNGSSWLLLADIICILLFPKLIAISGMLILSLADSTSALAGRLFGKKQFAPNRSYIGSITFFVVGAVIVFLMPKYTGAPLEYIIGLAAVMATTVADAGNFPTDDNFLIPIVYSGLLYIMYILFLPGVF